MLLCLNSVIWEINDTINNMNNTTSLILRAALKKHPCLGVARWTQVLSNGLLSMVYQWFFINVWRVISDSYDFGELSSNHVHFSEGQHPIS